MFPLRLSPDDEPAGAVADAPPQPPEEQAAPATEQEQEAPPAEEAADSGAGGTEEKAAEEAPSYDRSEILKGLDELAEADPELAEELRKRNEPPDAAEQQAKVQLETSQASRQQVVSQTAGQAFQYLGQNVDQGLDSWAADLEAQLQADVQALVQQQEESTTPVPVGNLLDVRTMRDQLKSYVQQSQVTYGNWREANIAHSVMSALEKSSARLTTDQRDALKQAQRLPSLDESLAAQILIHLEAASSSSDDTFKAKTKKELEQELGLVQKGAELMEKLGNGARARPARGGPAAMKGQPTIQEYAAATSQQRQQWEEAGIEPAIS